MKRRLLAILTVLAALGCLLLLPTAATEVTFQAGFGQVDITPEEDAGLYLSGYSTDERKMTGVQGELYASCVAVKDAEGTIALFLSVDTVNSNQLWSNQVKDGIVEANPDIVTDRIYISATGTLSAPEAVYFGEDEDRVEQVAAYQKRLIEGCVAAAEAAVADLQDVAVQVGSVDVSDAITALKTAADEEATETNTRMNWNAHYNVSKDGVLIGVAGDGFGPNGYINNNSYTVEEVAAPGDSMGLIQFVPTDSSSTPIVLVNWSARATLSSTGNTPYGKNNRNVASADYVGYFRDALEYGTVTDGTLETGQTQTCRTLFLQGTSGNVNAYSLKNSDWDSDVVETVTYEDNGETVEAASITPEKYGQKLALVAAYGLSQNFEAKTDTAIHNLKVRFATEPNLPTETEIALVNALKSADPPADSEATEETPTYDNLYAYMVASTANFNSAKAYVTEENGFTEEIVTAVGDLKALSQLTGINTRMQHTVNYKENDEGEMEAVSTNFATDAVYCDATMLQLGEMTFVMAPAELYCNYGENGAKDWSSAGADFILGNTNGASGYMPNAASYSYNEGTDYYTGTNITQSAAFPAGAGERLMETYANIQKTMNATATMKCECGGLAAGKTDHTCEIKEFLPWYDPDSLPVDGNYYLETDITLYQEARTGTGHKCLDLNGHTITRKVLPEVVLDPTGDEVPSEKSNNHFYKQTRMFALETNARLTVTDTSEAATGKLTRDISALNAVSEEEQKKITNYGLLIAIISGNTNGATVYKADLDASGQYSQGGACVANMSSGAIFNLYEGTVTGGISDFGSAIYNSGTVNLYGGTITGGQALDTSDEDTVAQNYGNVFTHSIGKLLLAGNTVIQGGTDAENKQNNLYVRGTLSIAEDYTGTAGITVPQEDEAMWNGTVFGKVGDGTTDGMLETRLTVDNDASGQYNITSCEGVLMAAKLEYRCECGGLENLPNHTHGDDLKWKPWPYTYTNSLPNGDLGGNYYLLADVTLQNQKNIASDMHLDLNGHTVTRVVSAAAEEWEKNTRVFYVGTHTTPGVGSLTVTDTEGGGCITRDLSALDEAQKAAIDNYGIIVLISEYTDQPCALYGGILDGSSQYAGGGTVANLSGTATFSMYGGEIKGSTSVTAGGIYTFGPLNLFGGTVTGGKTTGNGTGGVHVTWQSANAATGTPERNGRLVLGGEMVITGNCDANGKPSNIKVNRGAEYVTVQGTYTGTAGVLLGETPYDGMQVAKSDSANIDEATFTADNYAGVKFQVEDGYIVVDLSGLAAYVTAEDTSMSYHETLQGAFTAYPGGKATVTLMKSVEEDALEISQDTYLDLTGFDVTNTGSFTANGSTLYVFDTETDDYTVADEIYGKMTGQVAEAAQGVALNTELVGFAEPMDHYLKITGEDEVSFHRLNLRMDSISLRADSYEDETYCPGLYYYAQFGGDEVIRSAITEYGVGMAVKAEPTFQDPKSYTSFTVTESSWKCGMDAEGDSLNLSASSLLTGILKTTNNYLINNRNAQVAIYGQAYVLCNGERITGPAVNCTFREIVQGSEDIQGVDDIWTDLTEAERAAAVKMFESYSQLMRGWAIPNIVSAADYVQPTPDE